MSLNQATSPKRLSSLEMTFPSLDPYGYSDSDEDADVGTSKLRQKRSFRRTSPVADDDKENTSRSSSSDNWAPPAGGKRRLHQRHSSFAEYGGHRPALTSLAILAGLISGSTRIIDNAYAEQGLPVPDMDDPGPPKGRFMKEQHDLKITAEIYKAIEVCIEACHQLIGIVQRPEVTCAEAAYAVRHDSLDVDGVSMSCVSML